MREDDDLEPEFGTALGDLAPSCTTTLLTHHSSSSTTPFATASTCGPPATLTAADSGMQVRRPFPPVQGSRRTQYGGSSGKSVKRASDPRPPPDAPQSPPFRGSGPLRRHILRGCRPLLILTGSQRDKASSRPTGFASSPWAAAFNIADRSVISELHRRHRAIEFKKLLVTIDKAVPSGLDVHLVFDIRCATDGAAGTSPCLRKSHPLPGLETGQR
ncbi:hypothetical protein [Streptomyces sp. NPDC088246]|uniref:hypothetical protein n=1 Tax=Streptomyces sp. NPDC088246 TaxID=3365842 RepID=UPI003810DB8A